MNGCWLMWLGDCCIRLCWWGLCSCCEKGTGCSAARLPATLLITGTVWDCDVFKPGEGRRASEWTPRWSGWESDAGLADSLCAMAITPDRGMMRFCVCWWLWWELWMLVSVLTGGRPPPEPEIWAKDEMVRANTFACERATRIQTSATQSETDVASKAHNGHECWLCTDSFGETLYLCNHSRTWANKGKRQKNGASTLTQGIFWVVFFVLFLSVHLFLCMPKTKPVRTLWQLVIVTQVFWTYFFILDILQRQTGLRSFFVLALKMQKCFNAAWKLSDSFKYLSCRIL